MGQTWKNSIGTRKQRFLELYEAGVSIREIKVQLGMTDREIRYWCDRISRAGCLSIPYVTYV